ncbi:hypothetical protein N1851_034660 [Merluccius polli]|uniref:Gypsy retrotransposon integrase-like protein 1 n=1 Tax=Merluccius polli TaxID=89951 RepID=A0AA47LZ83_MERPO|nr:hypothetical protein N1851_034660 [Merluccius polli]
MCMMCLNLFLTMISLRSSVMAMCPWLVTRRVPVRILCDTGASESFICQSVLPFSSTSDTDSVVLIRGIGLHSFPVPLHTIELNSGFVNGEVTIAVRPSLPVDGIDLIMGNNLGGDCVFPGQSSPPPVVKTGQLRSPESDKCLEECPEVFTACAVTRAMARAQVEKPADNYGSLSKLFIPDLPSPLSADKVSDAQKSDPTLEKYFAMATDSQSVDHGYFVQNGLLLRKWLPHADTDVAGQVLQVVIPEEYRELVLKAAHGETSSHFGVKKTYNHVLQHFYWPRIKRDVAGKPNETIKPAPLKPIHSVGTPFEHLIVDCVGPLPKSKSGMEYNGYSQ